MNAWLGERYQNEACDRKKNVGITHNIQILTYMYYNKIQ
jgi:hypothetical protein